MPEIIRFSNDLCYSDTPLIPLRQYGPDRLAPLEHVFVEGGYREGEKNRAINRPEADAVIKKIVELCNNPRYAKKTIGVVVLQGEAQGALIESQLLELLGAEEMEKRRLVCGNPYSFQGDERDIMIMSMVAASNERIGPFSKPADERRFNVAASRARDQMILFHSVTCDDLSTSCLRRRLLEFFENIKPKPPGIIAGIERDELERRAFQDNRGVVKPPSPFDSWFEVDVALELVRKGFEVIPQYKFAGKRIDIVVQYGSRQLERCGWEFFRVSEAAFYANKENALVPLWRMLEERGILAANTKSSNKAAEEESGNDENDSDETEDYDSDHDGRNTSLGEGSPDIQSKRHPEEISSREISEAIVHALKKCPNHTCTLHSLTGLILKEVGVLTRGKPRKNFENRVMRMVNALANNDLIEKYRAKNERVRLLKSSHQEDLFFSS